MLGPTSLGFLIVLGGGGCVTLDDGAITADGGSKNGPGIEDGSLLLSAVVTPPRCRTAELLAAAAASASDSMSPMASYMGLLKSRLESPLPPPGVPPEDVEAVARPPPAARVESGVEELTVFNVKSWGFS